MVLAWKGKDTGEVKIFSGKDDDNHKSRGAIFVSREVADSMECQTPLTDHIITARFHSRFIKTLVIQVYTLTNDADKEAKENFYNQFKRDGWCAKARSGDCYWGLEDKDRQKERR